MKINNKWKLFAISSSMLIIGTLPLICLTTNNITTSNNLISSNQITNSNRTNEYDTTTTSNNAIQQKIDISKIAPELNEYYSSEFYEPNNFEQIKKCIQNNVAYIIPTFDPTIEKVVDISINKSKDNQSFRYGNAIVDGITSKKINGQFDVNISINLINNTTGLNSTKIYAITLCGFKRDQNFVFETSIEGKKINDAFNHNNKIILREPTNDNIKLFLIENIYYYKNYNDPINSIFTNIEPSMIRFNRVNNCEIVQTNENNRIFAKGVNKPILTLRFNNSPTTNSNEIAIILLSAFGGFLFLVIVVLIIIFAYRRKRMVARINYVH